MRFIKLQQKTSYDPSMLEYIIFIAVLLSAITA